MPGRPDLSFRASRRAALACAALLGAPLSGCLERVVVVESRPSGAQVWVGGRFAGTTPVEQPFSFYGTAGVLVRHQGHRSHHTRVTLSPPWYQRFPLDLLSDLWPLRHEHPLRVELEPLPEEDEDQLFADLQQKLARSRELARGGRILPEARDEDPVEGGP